ncbi:Golgi transport complex subunit 6 [Tulasnella sp. JGI-2019a]|nr:Golgi transport complex subunit 6 [Tulasnella sp. JGI-2019a]
MAAPKNPSVTRLQALAPASSLKGEVSLTIPSSPAQSLPLPTPLATPSTSTGFSSRFPTAVPSTNPIALRLYKVLGANYHDASTREALETLSSFYAPPVVPPPKPGGPATAVTLNGKQSAQDEDNEEEEEEDEAWGAEYVKARRKDALNDQTRLEVDGDAALRARTNLRRDVEIKLADSSRKFLSTFAEVDQKLDVLQVHITDMQSRCDEAQGKLQATHEGCKQLLDRAEGLRTQRQATAARQSIISLFLSRFSLTESETQAITSRDVPVGRELFDAMDRIATIRSDCRVLLSGEDGETKAGLDVMSLTSSLLDQGFQKLTRWCSFEFRQMGRDANLEVDDVMREAVRRLRQRTELLNDSLKILSEVRQNTVLNAFLDALTRGGPGGLPRPIELHAHDPTRYVGDMLAWVHQVMAGEHEFLDGLFDVKGDNRIIGSVRKPRSGESEEYVRQLLDTDLEKLCMPLKVRVLQTVKSQEGSITSYKIANLLQFYLLTVARTIGDDAILSQTLKQITDAAYRVFFDTIDAQGRSLLRFLHPPDADLLPPLTLRDASQVLREIMAVYESSLLGDEDPVERESAFSQILEASVDPAMEMCQRMSEMRREMSSWDRAVFLINCTTYMQNMLQTFSFTGSHVSLLQKEVDRRVKTLVTEHYAAFLHGSGLKPLIDAIDTKPVDTPLSRLPNASSQAVSTALTQFDTFLSNLDVSSSPRLSLMSVPRLASSIHGDAIKRIGVAYGRVCDAVRKPENKYEFAGTLLGSRRPFGDMRVLWQVLGVDEVDI